MSFRLLCCLIILVVTTSCKKRQREPKEEQIRVETSADDSLNSIRGNASLQQIGAFPSSVILTGMPEHRLITVYKHRKEQRKSTFSYNSYDDELGDDKYEHFMPGLDLLYGYNLLNIAHYDMKLEKLNLLFDHPVLVKSLYYPSFEQDSIDKKPINRDYYFVSVYDADTNLDTLINRKDLRHLYYFNASCSEKIQLVPKDYSVTRSQYDKGNDAMFVYARHDENKNGESELTEPLHVFRINLRSPLHATRLY